jgi:hypothetical protein
MDNFDRATAAARRCARRLVKDIPAAIVADGMITQALAAWAAETGRHDQAAGLLAVWAAVRDA